ncbi:MAG: hypothetical protein JWL75_700 [Parcubacteria group bacterium]|nr:hypothetical protein [Parcubacteria group bacterium]
MTSRIYSLALLTSTLIASPAFAQTSTVPVSAAPVADTQEPVRTYQVAGAALVAAPALDTSPDKPINLLPAQPTEKHGCHLASANIGVYSAYVFQDIAFVGDENPVVQADATVACASGFSFNVWTSAATKGYGRPYGNRGFGDEIDFTGGYGKTMHTPIGPVRMDVSVAYNVIADFGTTKDDVMQLFVQASRPIKVGTVTVTPYVRAQEWVGVGSFPNAFFLRGGTQVSIPLTEQLSFSGDLSRVFGLSRDGRNITRAQLSLSQGIGHNWSLTGTVKLTQSAKHVFALVLGKNF